MELITVFWGQLITECGKNISTYRFFFILKTFKMSMINFISGFLKTNNIFYSFVQEHFVLLFYIILLFYIFAEIELT